MRATVEMLRARQARIDEEIASAAVEGDKEAFVDFLMKERALPRLIAEAQAAPIREEIARLESELESLEAERQAALTEAPEVPVAMRSGVTSVMLRNRKVGGITSRSSRLGKELDERRRELQAIEAEDPKRL